MGEDSFSGFSNANNDRPQMTDVAEEEQRSNDFPDTNECEMSDVAPTSPTPTSPDKAEMSDELRFEHSVFLGADGVQCTVCGRRCKSQGGFTKHLKSHGIGVGGRFVCPLCNKSLSSDYSLNRHYRVCSALKSPPSENSPKQKTSKSTKGQGRGPAMTQRNVMDVEQFLTPDLQSPTTKTRKSDVVDPTGPKKRRATPHGDGSKLFGEGWKDEMDKTGDEEKSYPCQLCQVTFTSKKEFALHCSAHDQRRLQMMFQKTGMSPYAYGAYPFHPALAAQLQASMYAGYPQGAIPAGYLQQAAPGAPMDMASNYYEQQIRMRQLALQKSQRAEQLALSPKHPRKPNPRQTPESHAENAKVFPKVNVSIRTLSDEDISNECFELPEGGSVESEYLEQYRKFLKNLMSFEDASPFCRPQCLPVPDIVGHPKIEVNPLDLDTIYKRLVKGYFKHTDGVIDAIRCVFENSVRFFTASEVLHQQARKMQMHFEKLQNDSDLPVGPLRSSLPTEDFPSPEESICYEPNI